MGYVRGREEMFLGQWGTAEVRALSPQLPLLILYFICQYIGRLQYLNTLLMVLNYDPRTMVHSRD